MHHVDLATDRVILGLAVRTSLATAAIDIPAHWSRFMEEGIAARLASSTGDLYAVYCDYESDFRGPYTMVVGVGVAVDVTVPSGLRRVRIPAGRYASFDAKGDPAQVIWQTWAHVNGAWPDRGRRRYIADFERYPAGTLRPDHVVAEIGVGVD